MSLSSLSPFRPFPLWLSSLFPSCQHPLFWPLLFPLLRLLRPNGQTTAGNKVWPPSFSRHRDRQERKEKREASCLIAAAAAAAAAAPSAAALFHHFSAASPVYEPDSLLLRDAGSTPGQVSTSRRPPVAPPPAPSPLLGRRRPRIRPPPWSPPAPRRRRPVPARIRPLSGPPAFPSRPGRPLSTPPAAVPVKAPWRRSCPSSSRSTSR